MNHLSQPPAHLAEDSVPVRRADHRGTPVPDTIEDQSHAGRVDRTGHRIQHPPHLLWSPHAGGQFETLTHVRGNPLQERRPAREHYPCGDEMSKTAAFDL